MEEAGDPRLSTLVSDGSRAAERALSAAFAHPFGCGVRGVSGRRGEQRMRLCRSSRKFQIVMPPRGAAWPNTTVKTGVVEPLLALPRDVRMAVSMSRFLKCRGDFGRALPTG